jgi:hypothetical protein
MDRLSQRLKNQHIVGARLSRAEDVVSHLVAVQSQDYTGAKWSLGQRVRDATDAVVERSLASGEFLRTHVLRPTWHFVARDDIRWLLELSAPRVHALNAAYYRKLELDSAVLSRSRKTLIKALEGGTQLTRSELATELRQAGIVAEGQRLAYIMMSAELDAIVCSGAPHGKQQTYALVDERVPFAKSRSRDDAVAELVRRFLTSHGPATLKHFVWWSGLTLADAKAGLAAGRSGLPSERYGDTEWFGAAPEAGQRNPTGAYLIPEYDEALVGSRDFGDVDLPRAHPRRVWEDAFLRPIVIGGKRAGTWRGTIAKKGVILETNLFASLRPSQARALEAAAARYGRFLEMPATLA